MYLLLIKERPLHVILVQSLQAQAVVDAAGALRSAHVAATNPVAAAVPPPVAGASAEISALAAQAAQAIKDMFNRGCDVLEVKEFWLPHDYLLMRTSVHQHSDVNKYPPELKPKRLRKDVQVGLVHIEYIC